MDSFSFNNLQAEKANAILKHRQLRRIASLLRFVEVCVVLVMISRLSVQLPVAAKNSSEYFRGFSVFMVSPRFVFLIGNLIIITLFAQSGQFSAQGSRRNSPESNDLYQEFIQNSTKNQIIEGHQMKYPEKQNTGREESIESDRDQIKYPEKQSIRTEDSIKSWKIDAKCPEKKSINPSTIADYSTKNQRNDGSQIKWPEKQSMKTGDAKIGLGVKDYRRFQTEILSRVHSEKRRRVLNRCDTEHRRESIQPAPTEKVARTSYPEDDMSNDEFRRTVEAFIARQQRLRKEEFTLEFHV